MKYDFLHVKMQIFAKVLKTRIQYLKRENSNEKRRFKCKKVIFDGLKLLRAQSSSPELSLKTINPKQAVLER